MIYATQLTLQNLKTNLVGNLLYNLDCEIIGVLSKDFKTLAKRPQYSLLNKSKIKTTFNLEIPNYKQSLKNCIEIIKNES